MLWPVTSYPLRGAGAGSLRVSLRQTGTPLRCQFQIGTSPGLAPSTVTSSRSWLSGSGNG